MQKKQATKAIHTKDLARIIAEQANGQRIAGRWQRKFSVSEIYDLLLLITDVVGALLGEGCDIAILDFGRFEIHHKASRSLHSNLTEQHHSLPSRRSVRFKPFSRLQQLLNEDDQWN